MSIENQADESYPITDLTAFEENVLAAINRMDDSRGEGPHGLAICDELDQWYEEEVHHGRLYPSLDTLADKGLIKKGSVDGRTNSYGITARGKRELAAHTRWMVGTDA